MSNQVARTTQGLTTAGDMRNTTMMLMQPNANWEQYLTPAPMSIAIMGELVFISSGNDFSINKNPPAGGYKHIKYPKSFRACLMQICNSGWQAFNEAHTNMDQIRIHTGTIPQYMKAVVNILFNAPDEVVQKMLPNQLENISNIADSCVELAGSVEKKYMDVINLIQELLEACINADLFYGESLKNVQAKLKEQKMRQETALMIKEQTKKSKEAMEKQMKEAQEAFKDAMGSLPTGWEMIGMDLVEGFTTAMTSIVSGMANTFSGGNSKYKPKGASQQCEEPDHSSQITACSMSAEIVILCSSLKTVIIEGEIDWKELYDQKTKSVKSKWTMDQFKRLLNDLKKCPKGTEVNKAMALCNNGIAICVKLAKYTPEKKLDAKTTEQVIKDIMQLNDSALEFDSTSKKILASPALTPKPPMMYKSEEGAEDQKASQRATENARFKIEQSKEQLKYAREQYDKMVANSEKNQRELTDILIEMQSCEISKIDFETTIAMLGKGLDAMGRVKEQWEKMVRFFQMVSNIIKTSLSRTLDNFVKTAEDTKSLTYDGKLFAKDMLYQQAFQATNISNLLHMISTTYSEVSNMYLMDRVSSLGKLMAMEKSNPQFLIERQNLQVGCQAAQDGILRKVLKNKKDFEKTTDDRLAKIEGELKAILPAAQPGETERIQAIVQAGFGESESDYY